ncbi:hypothetical protein D9M72_650800 [compost metagenome]
MFSMTTMLSSTTRPVATANPPSVMMFSVTSVNVFKQIIAISMDSGIDTMAMSVARKFRRKNRMRSEANKAPSAPSRASVLTDSFTSVARLYIISDCTWSDFSASS